MLSLTPKRRPRDIIPLEVNSVEIGRFPPVVDTPRIPGYAQLIDHVMQRCGWNRADFIGIRYTLEYPPFPSTVLITFPLARRSQTARRFELPIGLPIIPRCRMTLSFEQQGT